MPRRPTKITKSDELPELLVATAPEFQECLEHLAGCSVIAFDTEFVGEDAYRPELCLVQVATPERLYVIDPFSVGSLDAFWQLLLDPNRTTVVHAGREEVRMCHFMVGQTPVTLFDIQIAAGLVGMAYPISYGGLVFELMGLRMTKGETLTDWRRRPLLPAQLRYAFDDVRYLLPVWKKLTDRLKRLKRLDWSTEEFATSIQKAIGSEESTAERWRKVKGIGGLDRRGLAVVREIFAWRERFAERVNRPPRQLLRDDLLVEIARRAPLKVEDLSAYRGVPRNEVQPILAAVVKARSLPGTQCPEPEQRESDPPHVVLLGNLLSVVLADWCNRHKLAPNLVASGSDLKAVVRSRVYQEPLLDIPLVRGWRAAHVLEELQAILAGTKAIRVVNPGSAAPLTVVDLNPDSETAPDHTPEEGAV